MGSGGVGLRNRSGLQIRRQPRAPTPRGAGFAPARPGAKSRNSKRQPILVVGLHDRALPASLGDGQLRRAPGTIGQIHDLLAKLVITGLLAEAGQSLGHMLRFYFLTRDGGFGRRQSSGGKTQGVRVQLEQPGRRRGRTEEQVWAADPSPASGPAPRGAGSAPARPGAKSRESKRQSILAVGLHDGALPTCVGDGQLRGAPGTIGQIHHLRQPWRAPDRRRKSTTCGSSCSSRGSGGAA